MQNCWQSKPQRRPSFSKLSEQIGEMLEAMDKAHFIELNDPFLMINNQRLEEGQSDYLAMLNSPTFENLSSPDYINNTSPTDSSSIGYLSMTSPSNNSNVFSFDDHDINPVTKSNKFDDGNKQESGANGELLPMLSIRYSRQLKSLPNNFSNPSYYEASIIEKMVDNNYVNMPKTKSVQIEVELSC